MGKFIDVKMDKKTGRKKKLIASSFLLNVYSTCDPFAINRYMVTALFGPAGYSHFLSGWLVVGRIMPF